MKKVIGIVCAVVGVLAVAGGVLAVLKYKKEEKLFGSLEFEEL